MKLEIETWIAQQNFGHIVSSLFSESIICYKSGAYKASYIFSYLAFLTILKERVLTGNKPSQVDEKYWQKCIAELRNEDSWEKRVIEIVKNRGKILFQIDDQLANHVSNYWKDRRNDCAHNKSNIGDAALTESFWSFLKVNLYKFSLIGSKEAILEEISIFLDPTLTRPEEDPSPIFNNINHAIKTEDLNDLFKEILVRENEKKIKVFDLFNRILNSGLTKLRTSLSEYISSKLPFEDLLLFVRNFPNRFEIIKHKPTKQRKILVGNLFAENKIWYNADCEILRHALNQDLIKPGEKKEHFNTLLEKSFKTAPDLAQLNDFVQHGISDQLREFLFERGTNIYSINKKSRLFSVYFKQFGVSQESAQFINNCLEPNEEEKYPWSLENMLKALKKENKTIIDQIFRKLSESKTPPSEVLTKILQEDNDDVSF